MIRLRTAVLVAAIGVSAPVSAERVVNYDVDEAKAAQDAIDQGVALAPLPARGAAHIAMRVDPAVDHQVLRVGITCSAWKIRNPMTALVARFLTAWDRDGAPAGSLAPSVDLLVTVEHAATLSRCVMTGELKTRCITRVSIDGSTMRSGTSPRPFHVEKEEIAKGSSVCAGMTLGVGLVSREAVAAMIQSLSNQASTQSRPG